MKPKSLGTGSSGGNPKKLTVPALGTAVFAIFYTMLRLSGLRILIGEQILIGLTALFFTYALLAVYAARNPGRAAFLTRLLTLTLAAGTSVLLITEIPIIAASRSDPDTAADYLIVLGAGVNGTIPSLSLSERLEAALEYLLENPAAIAIVSGGQGPDEQISEAEAMRRWLEAAGIEPHRIVMEDQSTSTLENLTFSKEIIEELGGDISAKTAIVTSSYHLYRAKAYARGLSMNPAGVAAKSSNALMSVSYYLRESAAVLYMWIFG